MKKISILLVLVMMLSLLVLPASAYRIGDIDGDGSISAIDARLALRMSVGLEKYTKGSDKELAADADHDGEVTAMDARSILRASVNLEVLHQTSGQPLTSKEVHKRATEYTVQVDVKYKSGSALGSGFAYDEDVIATNYHVIANADSISVKDYKGHEYQVASVLAVDRDLDLALLKLYNASFNPAELDTEEYETGDKVYTLGSSNGYINTFADGVIANDAVDIPDFNDKITYIQTTAPISPGNSGGPLIDEYARVIGVTEMTDDGGQNLNFAIPASYLKKLDTSHPMTLEEYKKAEETYQKISILVGDKETHLRVGGTAAYYFGATSNLDYSWDVSCDSDALTLVIADDGAYLGLFVVANAACADVPVTVSFKDTPDVALTLTVTADAAGCENFIEDIAPDFGAIFGVAPADVEENMFSVIPTLTYLASAFGNNPDAEAIRTEYFRHLEDLGFTSLGVSQTLLRTVTQYDYYNEITGVSVLYTETKSFGKLRSITVTVQ